MVNIEEIRKNAPTKWRIGNYAIVLFYLSVLFFFSIGCVIGYIFHPIVTNML